jgi:hypothetical protein
MLKTIAAVSPELARFVEALNQPLNTSQHRHVTQIADGLITTQGSKTLSALYRYIVGDPCPKSAADTFREAPWQADVIRLHRQDHAVRLLKQACTMVLQRGDVSPVLARYTLAPVPT